MNKLGILLTVIVLVLTPVIRPAASADRGSAAGMPTPTPTTTVDGTWGSFPGSVNAQVSEGNPDPEAMEDVRRDLLDLRDIFEELYPYAQHYAQVSGLEPPSLPSRQLIQALTHEELDMIREAFGDDYEPFKQNLETLKSLVLTPGKEPGEEKGQPSLDSFTIIPTPTPVTTPPPGITHKNHEQINEAAGDLAEPGYPTSVGCPKERFPNPVMLGLHIAKAVLDLANIIADAKLCQGTFVVVNIPIFGCVGTSIAGCLAWAVIHELALVANATYDGFSFCISCIDAAEREAARQNLRIIHADLADHDEGLTTRFNTTDKFLFEFRNLNLRSRIEDNLASPEDDPIALFTLPSAICITTDLEVINANNPEFSSGRIAGCGLLEVVSDTVRSAIDMNQNAGQSVHNAEAEFDAAVVHFSNGEYKLAYARFRKAYREAVRP